MTKMKETDINDVGKLLKPLWQHADSHGRCWGKKKDGNNPLRGSHITLLSQDEAVTVFFDKNRKQLKIIEYKAVSETNLGKMIKKALLTNGISYC